MDRWEPPQLAGPPGRANFCRALEAIYTHTGQLSRVVSRTVTEAILSDYVSYSPTLIAEAPADIHTDAAAYLGAVASFLDQFVAAGLDYSRLPPGALSPLTSPTVRSAYSRLAGYSTSQCGFTIGGGSTQP